MRKKTIESFNAVEYAPLKEPHILNRVTYHFVVDVLDVDPDSKGIINRIRWLVQTEADAQLLFQQLRSALDLNGRIDLERGKNIRAAFLTGEIGPEVTPQNMATAIRAKLEKSGWNQYAADSMLLDSMSTKPLGRLTEGQETTILEKIRAGDHSFLRALSRGMESERKPTFSPLERGILSGWDEVELYGHSVPGLKHWGPEAAAPFLAHLLRDDIFPENYRQTVKRLGMKKDKLLIRSFSIKAKIEEITLNAGSKDAKRYQKNT